MTEEQLKQLTDFAAAKRKEDLLMIREEIKNWFDEPARYVPNYDVYKRVIELIDKHLDDKSL